VIAVSVTDPKELRKAREQIDQLRKLNAVVIRVLTAEQALKAQRVVREAGRRER
jgi:uncharacterized protein with PIN domain